MINLRVKWVLVFFFSFNCGSAIGQQIRYSTTPLDIKNSHLLPGYIGNSPRELVKNLNQRVRKLSKGEFETTSEFDARLEKEYLVPLTGSLNFNSLYAFYYDGFNLSYEADESKFILAINDEPSYDSKSVTLTLINSTTNIGSFIGQNAFGVKKRIKVRSEVSINLNLWKVANFENDVSFEIERNKAIRIKPYIRVLILAKLSDPFLSKDKNVDDATISDPNLITYYDYNIEAEYRGLVLYDIRTGEIFYKKMASHSSDSPEMKSQLAEVEILDVYPATSTLKPTILNKPKPSYTPEARRNRVAGTILVSAVFTPENQIKNIRVIRGLPDGLNDAAISATKQIRFAPAIKDGKAVSVRMSLEFTFNLY